MANRHNNLYLQLITVFFIVIIFIISVRSYAQEKLSLNRVIDLSMEHNPSYKISIEKVNESGFKVREVWGRLWPELSTAAAYTRHWAEAGVDSRTNGEYDIRFLKGSISVNPGEFYNNLQASSKEHVTVVTDVRRVKADIVIETIKLYYQLMLSSEIIKLRNDSVKALEESYRIVNAGYKEGTFRHLDYLRSKVSLANERTRLIIAENEFQNSKAALNIYMSREIDEVLDMEDVSVAFGKGELSEAKNLLENEIEKIREMTAIAVKNRPEVLQLSLKKEYANYRSREAESVYLWPSLFISGSYGMTKKLVKSREPVNTGYPSVDAVFEKMNSTTNPEGWYNNWKIVFGATYRWGAISPLDSSHSKGKEYDSQSKQADLEIENLIRNVRLDVQRSFLKFKSSYTSLLSQEGNIDTAKESVRVALLQFKNGTIDNTRLLEANTELTNARTFYVQSFTDYQTAKAEINRAIGSDYFKF
jgi:outer membrane protein